MLNSRKTAVSAPRKKAERKKSGGLGGFDLVELSVGVTIFYIIFREKA